MRVEIPKIKIDIRDAIKDKALREERKRQENTTKSAWMAIYSAISGGTHKIAYWDAYKVNKPEYNSSMRYALHRSTKKRRIPATVSYGGKERRNNPNIRQPTRQRRGFYKAQGVGVRDGYGYNIIN